MALGNQQIKNISTPSKNVNKGQKATQHYRQAIAYSKTEVTNPELVLMNVDLLLLVACDLNISILLIFNLIIYLLKISKHNNILTRKYVKYHQNIL